MLRPLLDPAYVLLCCDPVAFLQQIQQRLHAFRRSAICVKHSQEYGTEYVMQMAECLKAFEDHVSLWSEDAPGLGVRKCTNGQRVVGDWQRLHGMLPALTVLDSSERIAMLIAGVLTPVINELRQIRQRHGGDGDGAVAPAGVPVGYAASEGPGQEPTVGAGGQGAAKEARKSAAPIKARMRYAHGNLGPASHPGFRSRIPLAGKGNTFPMNEFRRAAHMAGSLHSLKANPVTLMYSSIIKD